MSARPRTLPLVPVVWVLLVAVGAVASLLPVRALCPEIGLYLALYVGLAVGRGLPGAAATAFAGGYVTDLLAGAPKGVFALTLLTLCLLARAVAVRIDVRSGIRMAGFVAFSSLVGGVVVTLLRALAGHAVGLEMLALTPLQAVVSALFAPPVMSLLRRVGGPIAGDVSDTRRLKLAGAP